MEYLTVTISTDEGIVLDHVRLTLPLDEHDKRSLEVLGLETGDLE